MTRLLVVVMRDVAGLIMDGLTILGHDTGPCLGMDEARSEQSELSFDGLRAAK